MVYRLTNSCCAHEWRYNACCKRIEEIRLKIKKIKKIRNILPCTLIRILVNIKLSH